VNADRVRNGRSPSAGVAENFQTDERDDKLQPGHEERASKFDHCSQNHLVEESERQRDNEIVADATKDVERGVFRCFDSIRQCRLGWRRDFRGGIRAKRTLRMPGHSLSARYTLYYIFALKTRGLQERNEVAESCCVQAARA
jgi:hypothetical protein